MHKLKSTIVLVLFIFSTTSFDAVTIIGGKITTDNEGKGIFQITFNPQKYSYCTATKVGKNLILTSAHCLFQNSRPSQIWINEKSSNENEQFDPYAIKKVHLHPDYAKNAGDFFSYDVALIEVQKNTKFEKIMTKEMSFTSVPDRITVEYWGYGCRTSLLRPFEGYPVRKKALNTTLGKNALNRDLGGQDYLIRKAISEIYINNLITPGAEFDEKRSSLCFGDSGGPVFYQGKIVGINRSFTSKYIKSNGFPGSDATDLNLHLRLSVVKDWVQKILNELKG